MRWFWVDRFLEFESGRHATAVKNVSLAEEHLHDHFPGVPVNAFASFPLANFTFEGEPARYLSSPGVTRSFCSTCGTPLTYQAEDLPGDVNREAPKVDALTQGIDLSARK